MKSGEEDWMAKPFEPALKLAGLTRAGGYRAMKSGQLETYLVGRRRFITRKALEKFLALMQAEAA